MATVIKPQKGPQEAFLSTSADICIYGGSAGGGKSWSILYEPLRHVNNPGFNTVIFRRTMPQIMNNGSLWDASHNLYKMYPGAIPRKNPRPHWIFPSGAKVSFAHLERNDTVHDFQGTEICLIEFDELTHFTEYQFFYMLSRNRSTCGVRPYIRASCNPDPDSFVKKLILWWLDENGEYADPKKSGVIRYFARIGEEIIWGDTREEVYAYPEVKKAFETTRDKLAADGIKYTIKDFILSFTFIASSIFDNKKLLAMNPNYLSSLESMSLVEKERLLKGNWKIRPSAGLMFKRTQILPEGFLEEVPKDVTKWVRAWDLAATTVDEDGEAAYTAGVLMGKRKNGRYVVADVVNKQYSAEEVRRLIRATATTDKGRFKRVKVRLPQDPGQAGKDQAQNFIKFLAGFSVVTEKESGDKVTRAEPFATQWQAGNVDIVIGDWNDMYFNQLEGFPEGKWKDMVDASSSAFAELEKVSASAPPPSNIGNTKSSYWRG